MTRKYQIRKVYSALIGSLGVLCAGSTYVWVNPVQSYLKSDKSPVKMSEDEMSWFVAVVEVGDLAGTLPSGYLADMFGRKTVLFISGPLIVSTWLLIQLIPSFPNFILARILQGLAVGLIFTVTPTYLGEVSDKKRRGMAGTLVQTMWYVGILYQYIAGSQLTYYVGINVVCLTPALIFMVLLYFCPETPRYHLQKKEIDKAADVLTWLYGESSSKSQLESMLENNDQTKGLKSDISRVRETFIEILTDRRVIKSLSIVSMMAVTNVTGVTPVLSYSTNTFAKSAGVDPSLCTIVMGSLSLLSALIVAATVDKIGRRPLLLFSTISCTIVLFVGGFLHMFATNGIWSSSCLALYPPLMSVGPGTLTYPLMAELFTDKHRGIGAAFVTMIAAIATFIGLKFYSVIESTFGLQANFFILGVITILSSIVIYKFVPETKGKTFEEIQKEL